MFFKRGRVVRSSQKTRERRKMFLLRLLFLPVLLVVLVGLSAFLAHRQEVLIQDIVIEGASAMTEADIRSAVEGPLSGTYLRLFPRANIFIYPKKVIEGSLLDEFPLLESAEVHFKNFHAISVVVAERQPSYLWCGEVLLWDDVEAKECFLANADGVIFTNAPSFSGGVYLEFYGPVVGVSVREGNIHAAPLGFYFLPVDDFHFLTAFNDNLKGLGATPRKVSVMGDGDYSFILANCVAVLINQKQGLDALLGNLEVALETDQLAKEDLVGESSRLEYAYIRFKNKVLYKFK